MAKTNFVETGRVALINYGPDYGKWVVVLDIIDQSRVLADGSANGVKRQAIPTRWLSLTSIKIAVPRTIGVDKINKYFQISKVAEKVAATAWGKRVAAQKTRANLSDFDRFKVMLLKKQKAAIVKKVTKSVKA